MMDDRLSNLIWLTATHLSQTKQFLHIVHLAHHFVSFRFCVLDFPNLAPEWYAWLRHKRVDPPDDAEIEANAAAILHRQALARQLEVCKI